MKKESASKDFMQLYSGGVGRYGRISSFGLKSMEQEFVSAVNARRDKVDPTVWRPTGSPAPVRADSWLPSAEFALDGVSRAVLMTNGSHLGVLIANETESEAVSEYLSGPVTDLGEIASDVIGVEIVQEGVARVYLKHSQAIYLTFSKDAETSNQWHVQNIGSIPEFPPLHLELGNESTFSVRVSGIRTATPISSATSRLSISETHTLADYVMDGYRRLCSEASEAGYGIQPVLARYRIEDARGKTLAVGPTVFVGSSAGFQCTAGVTFNVDVANSQLNPSTLSAKGYTLRLSGLEQIGTTWQRLVHRVVVETSAPIEPCDASATDPTASVRASGSAVTLTFPLRGVAGSITGLNLAMQTATAKMLEENQWCEQAAVLNPFSGAVGETIVPLRIGELSDGGTPLPQCDMESYGSLYTSPGGMTIAADPLQRVFTGFSPAQFLTKSASGTENWSAVVVVTLRNPDGSEERAVSRADAISGTPQGFSPLLTYPDSRAVKIELTLHTAGGYLKAAYDMMSFPALNLAYAMAGSFQPVMPTLSTSGFPNLTSTLTTSVKTGELRIATSGKLQDSATAENVGIGRVMNMCQWPTGNGGWDYSREKVALVTTRGVFRATFTGENRLHTISKVAPWGALDGACKALDTKGRFLLVPTEEGVISVRGNKATLVEAIPRGATTAGYNPLHDEYWWTSRQKGGGEKSVWRGWVFGKIAEQARVDFQDIDEPIELIEWQGTPLLRTSSGLFAICAESFPKSGVRFAIVLRYDRGTPRPTGFACCKINLLGSCVNGEITIGGDRGSRIPEPLVKLTIAGNKNLERAKNLNEDKNLEEDISNITGDLNDAIVCPVQTGGRRFLQTAVDIMCQQDAELRPTEWLTSEKRR